MSRLLVDTNAYTALLSGDQPVLDALADADRVYLSVIVLAELVAGFRGGSRFEANQRTLSGFIRKPTVAVLDVTRETAQVFAVIKDALRRAGTPIPINDVWIAAHALETGAALLTRDAHFSKVPGLRIWGA